MKTNDVILKSLSAIISGCIFLLSLSLYFGGHFLPGGGFVGGLLCTMALTLSMFTYGTAFSGVVVGKNFFKHHFTHIHVPIMGEMELHTAAIFDLGVYFVVVGVLMSVILAFGKDGK